MIDEVLVERIYDALPKQPDGEPYYSLSAIRLILKTRDEKVTEAVRLAFGDAD